MAAPNQNPTLTIRPISRADSETWLRLRCELWPDGCDDHAPEIAAFFAGTLVEPQAVFVAEDETGLAVAVAELAVRTDLPSLAGTPVGYVEGLYVIPEARGQGVARALLVACRNWAHEQNCTAFASDRAGRLIFDPNFSEK